MFDRVGDIAEKVATHVCRRAFLGRLGQGALGLATAIGGVMGLAAQAHESTGGWCCLRSFPGGASCVKTSPQGCLGGTLVRCKDVSGCP
jgi:hypothetical protein